MIGRRADITYMGGDQADVGGVYIRAADPGGLECDLYLKRPISGTEGIPVTSRPQALFADRQVCRRRRSGRAPSYTGDRWGRVGGGRTSIRVPGALAREAVAITRRALPRPFVDPACSFRLSLYAGSLRPSSLLHASAHVGSPFPSASQYAK